MFSPFTHVGKIIPLSLISNIFLLYSLKSLGEMNQILQVGMSTFIWRMYLWWNLCTLYFSLIEGCTAGGICVPCILLSLKDVPLVEFVYLVCTHWMMYRWWNLCTLYVLSLKDVLLVEFVYLVCTLIDVLLVEFVYHVFYSHWRMYRWWNLCTLYVLSLNDVPLVEFVYLVCTLIEWYTAGGICVLCIYSHARWELQ